MGTVSKARHSAFAPSAAACAGTLRYPNESKFGRATACEIVNNTRIAGSLLKPSCEEIDRKRQTEHLRFFAVNLSARKLNIPRILSPFLLYTLFANVPVTATMYMQEADKDSKREPWRKVLYLKQNYPDNYTDASFLEKLQMNSMQFFLIVARR